MTQKQSTRKTKAKQKSARAVERNATKREDILEELADHVLANGLSGANLRPLAAAIGTSDRMLLYYFPDKVTLVSEILQCIAQRLATQLAEEVPLGRALAVDAMLATLWTTLQKPELRPYMRLWLELSGHAARGEEPHRSIGAAIAQGFLDWIAERLDEPARNARAEALSVLTQIEGMLLLEAFGISAPALRSTSRRR